MHKDLNASYYDSKFEPIQNAFKTGDETLAEFIDNLCEERRKELVEWMEKNEKKALDAIQKFTKYDK